MLSAQDLTSIYDAHLPLTLDLDRAPLKLSRVQESCCVGRKQVVRLLRVDGMPINT